MGLSAPRDLGINPLLGGGLDVGFAPILDIRYEYSRHDASCDDDALQHLLAEAFG